MAMHVSCAQRHTEVWRDLSPSTIAIPSVCLFVDRGLRRADVLSAPSARSFPVE